MRKVVAGLFVSLDGVAESPENWHFAYANDETAQILDAQMAAADVLLLGRRTYEGFAQFWPGQSGGLADYMNTTPKLVASRTLDAVGWQNCRLIAGDVANEVAALKREPGANISVTGSITLVRSLVAAGVLDELHLLVHPIVVGTGTRLFSDCIQNHPLRLVSSQTLSTGVLSLVYAPPTDSAPAATSTEAPSSQVES